MRIGRNHMLLVAFLGFMLPLTVSANSLQLYAAGSLKAALGETAASYETIYSATVATKFGPSGLLKKAIEGGENPDIFALANMKDPESLAAKGWGSPVKNFLKKLSNSHRVGGVGKATLFLNNYTKYK